MKHMIWLGILVMFAMLVPSIAYGEPPPPPPPVRSSNVSEQVLAKAQQQSTVRIIVQLDVEAQVEAHLPSPQAVRDQQNTIAAAQQRLLQHLPAASVLDVTTYKTIPFVAMRIDSSALDTLAQAPGVVHIAEDAQFYPQLQESIPIIGADIAHREGFTGEGWTIAIIDSGVDSSHPFLRDKVVAEACFSTTDPETGYTTTCPNGQDEQIGLDAGLPCTFDYGACEHGNHVAGIAAGVGDDMTGVASGATLISVQAISQLSYDDSWGWTSVCAMNTTSQQPSSNLSFSSSSAYLTSDLLQALEYVYELRDTHRIAAVNMSLGGGMFTSAEECDADPEAAPLNAIAANLRAAGIATIAAAGNDGVSDAMMSPACLSNIVSVGAVDGVDTIAGFSNDAPFLDLFAPGVDIKSSVLNRGFAFQSGTSMASPHVAGAWAVLKQANPTASVDEILDKLKKTGVPIPSTDGNYTTPRIQLDEALGFFPPVTAPISFTITQRQINRDQYHAVLSWENTDEKTTGFRIEREFVRYGMCGIIEGMGWELVAEVDADATVYDVTTYEDTSTLWCGETYNYRVQALAGNETSRFVRATTQLECIRPGDCDQSGWAEANDLGAIALEISDGRFNNYAGCDANYDMVVNESDIACAAWFNFGYLCPSTEITQTVHTSIAPLVAPAQPAAPAQDNYYYFVSLKIPTSITAGSNQNIEIPVTLLVTDTTVSSLAFSLYYTEESLSFNPNMPHAADFSGLPPEFTGMLLVNEAIEPNVINVAITDFEAPLASIPSGTVVTTLTLSVKHTTEPQYAYIGQSGWGPSFGDPEGKSLYGFFENYEHAVEITPSDGPVVRLPAEVQADENGIAEVPISLTANDIELVRTSFAIDYDDWVELDGAITFPAGISGTATFDPYYADGKLFIDVVSDSVYAPFPNNPEGAEIARLRFAVQGEAPDPLVPAVRFSQTVPTNFITTEQENIRGYLYGSTIIRPFVEPSDILHTVYIPIMRQ